MPSKPRKGLLAYLLSLLSAKAPATNPVHEPRPLKFTSEAIARRHDKAFKRERRKALPFWQRNRREHLHTKARKSHRALYAWAY